MNREHVVFNSPSSLEDITYAALYNLWQCRLAPANLKDMIGSQVIVKGGGELLRKGQTFVIVADIANVLKVKDNEKLSDIEWPSVVKGEDKGEYTIEIELTNIKTSDWNCIKDIIVPVNGKKTLMCQQGWGKYENRVDV